MPITRLLLILLLLANLLALAANLGLVGENAQRGEPERLTNQINPQALVLLPPPPRAQLAVAPSTDPNPAPTIAPTPPATPTPSPTSTPTPPAAPSPSPAVTPEPLATDMTAVNGADIEPPAATEPPPAPPPTPEALACLRFDGLGEQQAASLARAALDTQPELQTTRRMLEPPGNWWVHVPPAASRSIAEDRVATLRASGITDLFIVRDEGPHKNAISLGMFRTEGGANQHLANLRARRVTDARVIARKPAIYRLEIRGPRSAIESTSRGLAGTTYGIAPQACQE